MKKWGVYVAVALGVGVYNAATNADRDGSGAIVDGGSLDAFAIRVGDCFDDASSSLEQVNDVPGVPCSDPHDNEVYAVFDLGTAEFPGDALGQMAFDGCMERFETFVNLDYQSSSLEITTMYPSQESWSRQSDREVVCAVYDMDANKLVGSVKGLAL